MGTSAGTILVLGVTGQQGGATARHLLKNGWHVRGLTRTADQPAVKALEALGAEIVQGDMSDESTLTNAMSGVHGVFSVQPPTWIPTPESDANEVRLGRLAADVALKQGVKHFVYSSVLASKDAPNYGRTNYKLAIERHVWQTGLAATVLRPGCFMENLLLPALGIATGRLNEPTNPDVEIALISVDDIGAFAAHAFAEPQRFVGVSLDLAGDHRTPIEIAAAVARAIERKVSYVQVPSNSLRKISPLLSAIFEWTNEHGYPEVDVATLQAIHPGLQTLESWLANSGGQRLKSML